MPLNLFNLTFYCFQVRVRAQDRGTPPKSATGILLVNVTRNLNPPFFAPGQTNYNADILETQTPGVAIVNVIASDNDNTVSYIFII